MKRVTGLTLIVLASAILPLHLCDAGEGNVTADTPSKVSQNDKVRQSAKVARPANTRKARWWNLRARWYYTRAGELPWAPNAPGD